MYSRKATLKAHPDKEGGSEEKMASLNQAYEVISNPGTYTLSPISSLNVLMAEDCMMYRIESPV